MYIDYHKIVADNYNLYITEERLNEIKALATKEKAYIFNKNSFNNITALFARRANEIAYINARNKALNAAEKALLASNIVFEDDRFITILKKGAFELSSLETFIKLVNYIKHKIDNNRLTNDDQKYITTVELYAKKLVDHFTKYVGPIEANIIINKLNEILSFKYELLEDNEKKRIR